MRRPNGIAKAKVSPVIKRALGQTSCNRQQWLAPLIYIVVAIASLDPCFAFVA